ncbi:LOW QUALITY PROTEIN: uncharacterized protein LOC129229806 [Uloborus diversus]|uniref:LOW QUALITY PROTEIN: uncharacterized protein LOC129229806 n=1 Tax=Uloborus diversus TaxID=327109 RepID=UPI0024096391|nr:LOW QUALITY PROTEIN: uncharacterized protein LOC129229806 [Uloborus diversus]
MMNEGLDEAQWQHSSLKPPPFWKSNPNLWFLRLEAQFSLVHVTADETKFNYVVAAIDSDILSSVSDIIVRPPDTNRYETVKKRLIDLHSESEFSKIRTLLQGLELGDQRPSQLLMRMRTLGGDSVGEPLVKSLWLGRLPSGIQSLLAVLNEDLTQLASIADKIHDLMPQASISAAHVSSAPQNLALQVQIDQLTQQVQ